MRPFPALALAASSLVLGACARFDQSTTFADVMRPQVLVIRAAPGAGQIHALNVRCHGNVEGDASITLMLDGRPYRTEKFQGRFSFGWSGDWYAREARLHYLPDRVRGGAITIDYRFVAL